MKKKLLFVLTAFCFAYVANAQKPFKEIGKDNEVDVLTVSNGRYIEHFTNDKLRQIGSVMFNMATHQIEYFIPQDDTAHQQVISRAKEASRFMSVDPLTSEYPELSPYQFASNTPIAASDLDGLEADLKFEGGISSQMVGSKGVDKKTYNEAFDKMSGDGGAAIGMASALGFGGLYSIYKYSTTPKPGTPSNNPRTPSNEPKIKKVDANQVKGQTKNSSGYEKQTDSQLLRSKDKYEKLIEEHKQKIEDFKKDPEGQSDPEQLRIIKEKAPDKVKDFFQGRVKSLEKQLKKQEGELEKINTEIDTRGLNQPQN